MLAVEGVLLLSEPFRWLGFGWWKGHRDLKVSITNHLPAAGKVGEVDREKLGLRKIKRNNRHSCKDVLYKRFTSGPAFWSVGPLSTPISNSAAVTAARAGGE
jgi:hypothetical protein